MNSTYPRCLAKTLQYEGGWSNNPKDPGGATMKGVTQAVYDAYRRRKGSVTRSVRAISDPELQEIYRQQYWNAVRGDDLPSGIDCVVFDYAVNSGPVRAIKALQSALGVRADGHIGEATLSAISSAVPADIIDEICDSRLAFMKGLTTWSTFGRGWSARVASVRQVAKSMAGHPAMIVEDPEIPAPAKARPENQKVLSTSAGKAGALSGVGTVGEVATSTADKLSPFGDSSAILHAICALLIIVGAGAAIYLAFKGARSAEVSDA